MLVVVADVERQPIERPVIRVRLLPVAKHVMLGNVVTGDRMQAHHDQRADRQVRQGFATPEVEHRDVEAELQQQIQGFGRGRLFGMHEQRAQRIGKALTGEPHQLGQGVAQHSPLELGRQIRVQPFVTLMGVMQQVIVTERLRHRHPDWQVHEHGEGAVVPRLFERQVVAELVDRQQQRLVDHATYAVGHDQQQPPRCLAQRKRQAELQKYQRRTHVFGAPTRPVQRLDLRVLVQHVPAPFGVRLARFGPAETRHRGACWPERRALSSRRRFTALDAPRQFRPKPPPHRYRRRERPNLSRGCRAAAALGRALRLLPGGPA